MRTLQQTIRLATLLAIGASGLAAQDLPILREPSPDEPPTRQGTRGANFLEIGTTARGIGMGGAIAALVEGPSSWYWNPAGAASAEQFGLALSRQNLYEGLDIAQNFAAATLPFAGGVIGASFTSLSSGDIDRTSEGDPTGADAVVGSTFNWTSTAIGLGYARRLTDRLDVGGQVKYVSEGITDARIGWVALDLGTQFRTGLYGLIVGATIQNVGPSARMGGPAINRKINSDEVSLERTEVSFRTQEVELPTLFRFSVANDLYGGAESLLGQGNGFNTLNGSVEFSDAIDSDVQLAWGLEYGFRNFVFARLGKRFYNDERQIGGSRGMYGLSGGVGARLPLAQRSLRFDYAFTSLGDLQNVQVFSFEFGQ